MYMYVTPDCMLCVAGPRLVEAFVSWGEHANEPVLYWSLIEKHVFSPTRDCEQHSRESVLLLLG